MRQTDVVDGPAIGTRNPVGVQAFQLVGVAHPFRRTQMNSRKTKLDMFGAWLDDRAFANIHALIVGGHVDELNDGRRLRFLVHRGSRIGDSNSAAGGEPEAAIVGSCSAATHLVGRALRGGQSVGHPVVYGAESANPASGKLADIAFGNAADPARRA